MVDIAQDIADLIGAPDLTPDTPQQEVDNVIEVSAPELAEWLAVKPATISALWRDGRVVRTGNRGGHKNTAHMYDLKASVRTFCGVQTGKCHGTKLDQAKTEKALADARKASVQADAEEGKYVLAKDVENTWTEFAVRLRAAVLAIPGRVGVSVKLDRKAHNALETECQNALEEIAHAAAIRE